MSSNGKQNIFEKFESRVKQEYKDHRWIVLGAIVAVAALVTYMVVRGKSRKTRSRSRSKAR